MNIFRKAHFSQHTLVNTPNMKNLFFALIFTLLAIVQAGAQTQEANPELKALVTKALAYYPTFIELDANRQNSNLRVDIARAQYRPTVTANGSVRYVDPVGEVYFGEPGNQQKLSFQPKDNYDVSVGASGIIFDFGKTKSQIDKALLEAQLGSVNTANFANTLAYQIAQLYYGIIYSKRAIAVQNAQVQALESNRSTIEVKVKSGDALELDLLNASVALQNARNRLTDLEAQLEKQRTLLNMYTGDDGAGIVNNAFDYSGISTDLNAMATNAQNANTDLQLANQKILIANQEIAVMRHQFYPSLTYNTGLGFRNGYQPDIRQFRFNYFIGVGLSYPIYVGGRDRKQLHIAELSLIGARATLGAAQQNVTSELGQALADVKAGQRKLDNATVVIHQAEEALKIAQGRFKNGVATNYDVLTAQANLEQAQLAEIQYQYQLCLAKMQLSKLQGVKFW